MKKQILKILTLFTIMISLIGCSSSNKTGKINEPLTIDDITVTVKEETRFGYTAQGGGTWFALDMKIENNSKKSIGVWWTSATLVYADGYEYKSDTIYYAFISDTRTTDDYVEIKPLNTYTYGFGFPGVPDSLPKDTKPLKVKITLNGSEFVINLR